MKAETLRLPLVAALLTAGVGTAAADLATTLDTVPSWVIPAMVSEMERNRVELSLPDAPEIYHLRYHVALRDTAETAAAYGAELVHHEMPANDFAVELRLGSPQFDNTGFVGGQTGFGQRGMPDVPTAQSLTLDAWLETDAAYKASVNHFATKVAEYSQPPDHPGDYQMLGATTAEISTRSVVNGELVRSRTIALSNVFTPEDGFERAEVRGYHQSGLLFTVDTEGTRVVRPTEEAGMRAVAFARCEDGSLLSDHRSWFGRSPAQWPSSEEMAIEVSEMNATLQALSEAPTLDGEYVGPVIFEGDAAVELFRYLLVGQLEGTPPDASSTGGRGIFGSIGGDGATGARLSRRVLPPGWVVTDDPSKKPSHVASFAYDDEGTPTQRVELVKDGIVKTVLMSRVPRKDVDGTNGHARSNYSDRAQGRAMMMEVRPPKHLSARKLYRQAHRLARAYDRDYVIVVRRLQDPPVRGYADFAARVSLMVGSDGASTLPPPIYISKLYTDGTEEPIRGAAFANVQRFALRDLVAAGEQRELTYLADIYPGMRHIGLTDGYPTWLSAPDVLVGELELVPSSGDPKDKGVLPLPQ